MDLSNRIAYMAFIFVDWIKPVIIMEKYRRGRRWRPVVCSGSTPGR